MMFLEQVWLKPINNHATINTNSLCRHRNATKDDTSFGSPTRQSGVRFITFPKMVLLLSICNTDYMKDRKEREIDY